MPKNEILATDQDLIELTASGDTHAFGQLWQRHTAAAMLMAQDALHDGRSHASRDEEDLVSEAFARILLDIRSEFMPEGEFAVHLRSTIDSVAGRWTAASNNLSLCTEAIVTLEAPEDTVDREAERQLAVDADVEFGFALHQVGIDIDDARHFLEL